MGVEVLIPIFGIVGVFGCGAYIAYVILEGIRARQQARLTSEFHHKLLDRVAALPAATPAMEPTQLWWKAQLLRRCRSSSEPSSGARRAKTVRSL